MDRALRLRARGQNNATHRRGFRCPVRTICEGVRDDTCSTIQRFLFRPEHTGPARAGPAGAKIPYRKSVGACFARGGSAGRGKMPGGPLQENGNVRGGRGGRKEGSDKPGRRRIAERRADRVGRTGEEAARGGTRCGRIRTEPDLRIKSVPGKKRAPGTGADGHFTEKPRGLI